MRGKINGLGVKNVHLAAYPSRSCGAESKTKMLSKINDGVMFDIAARLARKKYSEDECSTGEIMCPTNKPHPIPAH